jgi:entericidin B
MVRKFVAVALIVAGLGLSACNTVEGAGKDVKSAGNAVEGAAKDAK